MGARLIYPSTGEPSQILRERLQLAWTLKHVTRVPEVS